MENSSVAHTDVEARLVALEAAVRELQSYFSTSTSTNKTEPETTLEPKPKPPDCYKILVVGDHGVGKSSFCHALRWDADGAKEDATGYVSVTRARFSISHTTPIYLWDVSGGDVEKCDELEHLYVGAHAAILMFDVTRRTTYKHIQKWHKSIIRICENIPIMVCGNKIDSPLRVQRMQRKDFQFHHKKNLQYYDISAKTGYNMVKPLLYIERKYDPPADVPEEHGICL